MPEFNIGIELIIPPVGGGIAASPGSEDAPPDADPLGAAAGENSEPEAAENTRHRRSTERYSAKLSPLYPAMKARMMTKPTRMAVLD